MKKGLKIGLIAAGIVTALVVAYSYLNKQVVLLQQYCTKIKKFKISSFNNKSIGFSFDLYFENKSNLSVAITSINIDVLINDMNLGSIVSNKYTEIQPKNISVIPLNFIADYDKLKKINLQELAKIVANYLTDKSKIQISMNGKMRVKKGFIESGIPIKYSSNLQELMTEEEVPVTCNIK